MNQHPPTTTPGLSGREAERLADALASWDVTIFVDGTSLRLPEGARDAVVDLLSRLTRGEAVTVTSAVVPPTGSEELLTTSQAAALAGISHTYLRNLTSEGVLPVQYRGSHRRIRRSDVQAWLARQGEDGSAATSPADLLTTSQAAALAGISATYLRNLTTEGVLPVQYRGSHRRVRRSDVEAWLAGRQRRDDDGAPAPEQP
ncbi:helix-turn-helix domain-containing protein [uncultured Kocuria sp.]|uniref:helix-turn-helix domain-containing protein n=1 Tax=uncultured Kocuria sp. TaxID=259305 RepID=UPI0026094F22|nr:helix-turn-helix domain-containing protein [uncultured Kocuria sp.]